MLLVVVAFPKDIDTIAIVLFSFLYTNFMYYFANLFIYIQYIVSYICVTFLFEYIKHWYYSCDAKLNFQHLTPVYLLHNIT